jgi:hypothetical protein
MIKRTLFLLLLMSGLSFAANACIQQQPPAANSNQQQPQQPTVSVMGLKIAFVTRQLNLSSDEAQKFWPVYYDYVDDMKQARDEEKDVLTYEERILNLRKRYKVEYKKILGTDERANKALTIDRDFNEVVKKELQQRAEFRKQRKMGNQ